MESLLVIELDLREIEGVVAKFDFASHWQAVHAVAVTLETDLAELVDAALHPPEKQGVEGIQIRDPLGREFAKVFAQRSLGVSPLEE